MMCGARAAPWRLLAVTLLLLAAAGAASPAAGANAPRDAEEEPFIGWRGDTYKPKDYPWNDDTPKGQADSTAPWVQVLSWRPRAFVYHNFLSSAEAAHIIKLAAPQMKRSTVVGRNNSGVVDDIRTSAGMFINRNFDPIITTIEQRLASWTQLPPSHQEDMQVLRYAESNKYGAHIDGLGRVATVLIYLIPPEEGGETAFPQSDAWLHPEMGEPSQGAFSQCAKNHVAYKPKRGDALLFYDVLPDGHTPDQASMHTGCPVVKGVKWNAVKWIHGEPFRESEYLESLTKKRRVDPDPGLCADRHEMCARWAASGECKKNPGYMTGSNSGQGMCRLSCGECRPCKPRDLECIRANRVKGGYMTFDEAELKLAELGVPAGEVTGFGPGVFDDDVDLTPEKD